MSGHESASLHPDDLDDESFSFGDSDDDFLLPDGSDAAQQGKLTMPILTPSPAQPTDSPSSADGSYATMQPAVATAAVVGSMSAMIDFDASSSSDDELEVSVSSLLTSPPPTSAYSTE
jgi:hypothetical protein